MVYDLPLVEEKVKPHQITTLHLLCALAFIGTGAIIAIYNYTIPALGLTLLGAGLLLLIMTIVKNKLIISRKVNSVVRVLELLVTLGVVAYSAMHIQEKYWKFPIWIFGALSAAILFALYWERSSGNKLFIHVDDDGLKLPVVRKRSLPWTEVEQIVYRFGTLTINCTDNHLFQWSIADESINADAFETYCKNKIEEHIDKRRKDDW